MTTAKEIKRLCTPLLEANDDLIFARRDLILTPIRHVASGVLIDATSCKEQFRPCLYTQTLFVPYEYKKFLREHEIYRPGGGLWMIDETPVPDQLFDLMHNTILPEQRKRRGIKAACEYWLDVYKGVRASHLRVRSSHETMIAIALGDLDEAAKRFRTYKDEFGLFNYQQDINAEVPGLGDRLTEQGNALGAEDRAALAGVLHTFEEFTVTNLKLTKYWERTPFPLEETI